jgi:hypothetical protein
VHDLSRLSFVNAPLTLIVARQLPNPRQQRHVYVRGVQFLGDRLIDK